MVGIKRIKGTATFFGKPLIRLKLVKDIES